MRSRSAAALAASALVAAFPGAAALAADPPSLRTTYPCYSSGESVLLTGSGFTPDGEVALSLSGQQLTTLDADTDGGFSLRLQAPDALFGTTSLRFTATDRAQPRLSDHATLRIADSDVLVTPMAGTPEQPRRIRAWGFFGSHAFYAHVKRRGARRARNIYLGTPRGPCGVLDVERRLFRRTPRQGAYVLQFDALRRYYPNLESSVTYRLDVLGP
ncbi:MAG TPA: hypothetical protein VHF88_07390 [Thermoleophilaceae bacterium]|nr:hypothetical protein [Thermoleophilaceae bacterium]